MMNKFVPVVALVLGLVGVNCVYADILHDRDSQSPCLSPDMLLETPPAPWTDFTDNAAYFPRENYTSWRSIYARTLQLPDDSLLITWEDYPPIDETYFPIYKSTDGGATWWEFSRVYDQVNNWGLRYQSFLYRLDTDFGGHKKGTILITGPSVPANLSEAYIDLYASEDEGKSWQFVSHIVYGAGPETVADGNKAVWEPFLIMYEDQLVCFFSDQRDPAHAQKLAYKTTRNLKTWSAEVNAVAQPAYADRPGMATVAHIESTGKYIMTFEYCGGPIASGCPVYYKVAESPLEFGPVEPLPMVSNGTDRLIPNGSPYVIWTRNPGRDDGSGLILANGDSLDQVMVNEDAGAADGWKAVDVGQWSAYSRSLRTINTPHGSKLLLGNGGNMGCSGSCYNWVAVGVVDIPT